MSRPPSPTTSRAPRCRSTLVGPQRCADHPGTGVYCGTYPVAENVKPFRVISFRHDTPTSCTLQRKPATANVLLKSNVNAFPDFGERPGRSAHVKPGSASSPTAIALGATAAPSGPGTVSGSPGMPKRCAPAAVWQPASVRGRIAQFHFPLGVVK